jgi:hypothetical protein
MASGSAHDSNGRCSFRRSVGLSTPTLAGLMSIKLPGHKTDTSETWSRRDRRFESVRGLRVSSSSGAVFVVVTGAMGTVTPVVDRTFPLSDVPDAIRYLRGGLCPDSTKPLQEAPFCWPWTLWTSSLDERLSSLCEVVFVALREAAKTPVPPKSRQIALGLGAWCAPDSTSRSPGVLSLARPHLNQHDVASQPAGSWGEARCRA